MRRSEFVAIAETLRNYGEWEKKLYALGIDLTGTPVNDLVDYVEQLVRAGKSNWSYDKKLEFDWIIEWVYSPDSPNFEQTRHGRRWILEDAGILYDFIEFMNEYGWEAK
jgi:hypothetical protein